MASLDRDEWPLLGEHTNKTGSSASKATQSEKLSIQSDKGSVIAKRDFKSPSKKSNDGMGKAAQEPNPSHKGNRIQDDTSRAKTSRPRDTNPSNHQPSRPRSKSKGGKRNSSRPSVQGNPESPHHHDEREDDDRHDRFDDLEENYYQNAEPKRGKRQG